MTKDLIPLGLFQKLTQKVFTAPSLSFHLYNKLFQPKGVVIHGVESEEVLKIAKDSYRGG